MRTRNGLNSDIRFHRHCKRYFKPAAVHWAIAAARPITPARFKSLADVREAEAGSFVGGRGELVLAAVLQAIADLEDHSTVVEMPRLDADHHRLTALRHAIFDRILDDRLQQQRGHA